MKHRRDANHGDLQKCFEELFCSAHDTSMVGDGFTDMVVGINGRNFIVEAKTENGRPEKSQIKFDAAWRGGKRITVRTRDDVIAFVMWARSLPPAEAYAA